MDTTGREGVRVKFSWDIINKTLDVVLSLYNEWFHRIFNYKDINPYLSLVGSWLRMCLAGKHVLGKSSM